MPISPEHLSAAYALSAVGVWGASDFLGGIGARRANAYLFTAMVHVSGMVLMGSLALFVQAPFPGTATVFGALLAGSVGGISLALFYRALASGKMGLTAPVAAVRSAALPTIVTAFSKGLPG